MVSPEARSSEELTTSQVYSRFEGNPSAQQIVGVMFDREEADDVLVDLLDQEGAHFDCVDPVGNELPYSLYLKLSEENGKKTLEIKKKDSNMIRRYEENGTNTMGVGWTRLKISPLLHGFFLRRFEGAVYAPSHKEE